MRNIKNRKAFTIVEMVIVIAVIAILATVLVPTISGVIQMANKSADTQFAASLNVQLALWEVDNGEIADEHDLRDAINFYYGDQAEDGDYFATMTTKSVKQGNYYWYDYTNKVIEVGTVEEMANKTATDINGPTMSSVMPGVGGAFSPASFRSGLVMGYYLMGGKGHDGDLLDVISQFAALAELDVADPDAYTAAFETLYALQAALEEADETDSTKQAVNTLVEKAENSVVNCASARYTVSDQTPDNVWTPKRIEEVNPVETYRYSKTDKDTDDGSSKPIVLKEGTIVELPTGVTKITTGALVEVFVDENNNAVELHINTIEGDLGTIFEAGATDCVIVLSSGETKYEFEGDITIVNKETREPVADNLTVSGIETLEGIEIKYDNGTVAAGGDDDYFYDGTLYLAWDFDSAKASLEGKLSDGTKSIPAGMANWTVSEGALIQVSPKGVITLKEGATPEAQKTLATVTATLKSDESKTYSVNVQLVFPTALTWKLDNTQYSAPATYPVFDLIYTEATEFTLALAGVNGTQDGYVKMNSNDLAISFATTGDLFSIDGSKLVLDPGKIETNPTQKLTVTYGSADNAYITQEYTVTAKDHSSVGVKKNQITNTVTMGDYLFRVGNGNAFALGKLFSAVEAGKTVKIQSVNIYDASKTSGTNGRVAIATSGSGFTATYTASSNWSDGTIKFSGTGVAIIEVVTDKGPAELAVEVVSGKNVTAAGDFSGATNYVLLNNITWGTANKTAISGIIYGNGFAINAQNFTSATTNSNNALFCLNGGIIDNLVIHGPVYPELIYQSETSSSRPYYVAGVYTTGNATIINSYISGFREPIMADSTLLHLENTTLVGGNYANLWLNKGSLYLKNVTTVQEKTQSNFGSKPTVLGAGIIVESGISNISDITIDGELNQYNWVTESEKSYLDSDIRTAVGTLFRNATITHNGRINTGILFMGTRSNAVNDNRSNKTAVPYQLVTVDPASIYTYVTTNGAVSTFPTYGGYTPNAQMILKPTFKDNLTKTDSKVQFSIDIPSGETATLDVSGYTVSKYYGQILAVNVSCNGGSQNGKVFTFSTAGTYTLTYTVEDNTFYNSDGTKSSTNIQHTYTVTVVVINKNHANAVINVGGVNKTIYMNLENTKSDTDYAAAFAILDGLTITDYNADGSKISVTVPANALPSGLTVTASGFKGSASTLVEGGKLYLYDTSARADQDGYGNVTVTYKYTGKNGKEVSATVTYSNVGTASYTKLQDNRTSSCVTPDTLVTLADGTQKEIQYVTYEDMLLVWNFNTGKYDVMPASIVMNHGYDNYTVVTLNFSDGTTVNTINGHGFFDAAEKKYVIINSANVADYVGREFVKVNGNGYTTVTLDNFSISEQYTESWSILTAVQYNCILENMWTLTPAEVEGSPDYLMPFEIGKDMKYDEAKMQADIEKYGLYTYDDFAAYCTYEQFVGFGLANWKVAVGKGYITWDGIEFLLNLHLGEKIK